MLALLAATWSLYEDKSPVKFMCRVSPCLSQTFMTEPFRTEHCKGTNTGVQTRNAPVQNWNQILRKDPGSRIKQNKKLDMELIPNI